MIHPHALQLQRTKHKVLGVKIYDRNTCITSFFKQKKRKWSWDIQYLADLNPLLVKKKS